MRHSVLSFFDDNLAWLAELLEAGRAQGSLAFSGTSEEGAQMIIGALEGSMLVARAYGATSWFERAASRLVTEFAAADHQTL